MGWPVSGGALTFVSDRGDDGRRLDLVLLRHLSGLPGLSRTRVQALVQAGAVEVGGRRWMRVAQRLQAGTTVRVSLPDGLERREGVEAEELPLEILHEDEWLLVVNKPSGLIVHPSYGHRAGTLMNALVHYARAWPGGRPSLVHRLDKHTSGAVIVAKSPEVHAACASVLAGSHSRKDYVALCYGRMRTHTRKVREALGPDPSDRRRAVVRPDGASAATDVTRLELSRGSARGLTLVGCRLLTGRTHQIRAHLRASGLPIVGDPVYGEPYRKPVPDGALDARLRAFGRQALHAWRVSLPHPMTGAPFSVEAPLPADLAELLDRCGLAAPGSRASRPHG